MQNFSRLTVALLVFYLGFSLAIPFTNSQDDFSVSRIPRQPRSPVTAVCANAANRTIESYVELCSSILKTCADTNIYRDPIKRTSDIESNSFLPRDPMTPDKSIIWCATDTDVYLIITLLSTSPSRVQGIIGLIRAAAAQVHSYVQRGDGIISAGIARSAFNYHWMHGFELHTWNWNNKRLTWTVMNAVLITLYDFMNVHGFGSATFQIYDAGVQVGKGFIG